MSVITFDPDNKSANISLSNGNKDAAATNTAWKSVKSTETKNGKYYFEVKILVADANRYNIIGVGKSGAGLNTYVGGDDYGWGYNGNNGYKFHNTVSVAYGNTFTTNDVIGVAFDTIDGKLWFAKNNAWQASGDPVSGANPAYSDADLIGASVYAMFSPYTSGNKGSLYSTANEFVYSAPEGYRSISAAWYFSGYVYEQGNPVSRIVRLYNRDTGALADEGTSLQSNGYYYLETTYSGEHFIICLDDAAGETYNLLGYDLMVPADI